MTAVRERRYDDPPRPPRRRRRRLLVTGGVVVALVIACTIVVLLARGDDGVTGSGGVRGSGVATSQTRHVPTFSAVELAGGNNVSVRVGGPPSVVVHGDDNLVGRVLTSVSGGTLVVQTTGSFTTRAPMRVAVTVPRLTGASLTGSGNLVVDGVHSSAFRATLPGSGQMMVSGRTGDLRATLDGSGEMNLHDLTARTVEVRLPGSGEVEVWASESLDAEVSGSGSVRYAGDPPHVTHSVTGSGEVVPE